MNRFIATNRVGLGLIALLFVAAALAAIVPANSKRTVTVYFSSAPALYVGNPVEVLGVPVGKVTEISPESSRVKVVLEMDGDVKLPEKVEALQVAPSLISGRSVDLAPVYTSGPELKGDAVIPETRTEVPLDVNDLYQSAKDLSTALGPDGANKNGAVSRALDVAADNLRGNGTALAAAIRDLAGATGTLSDSRGDLTGTIRGLQTFVSTLKDNDSGVRTLNTRLATVSGFLADDRDELAGALQQLSISLGDVAGFVQENRAVLKTNVDRLTKVTAVLTRERAILAAVLDEAPNGLGNLLNSYDAAGGTLDVRMDVNELRSAPGALVCELVNRGAPGGLPANLVKLCSTATQGLNGIPTLADLLGTLQTGGAGAKKGPRQ